MSNFVLSLLNDLSVPSPHCLGEAAALFADMGYLKACSFAIVVVKEGKNNEGVPDMINSEDAAKLPSTCCEIALLLFRERHIIQA
jgi:hypothetical protein